MYLHGLILWHVLKVTGKVLSIVVVVTRPLSDEAIGAMEAIGVVSLGVKENSIGY
jgi:hypothetical protein